MSHVSFPTLRLLRLGLITKIIHLYISPLLPFLPFSIIAWKISTLIKSKLSSYFACKSHNGLWLEKNLQLCWLLSDKSLTTNLKWILSLPNHPLAVQVTTLKPDYIIVDKWSNFANYASANGTASYFTEKMEAIII